MNYEFIIVHYKLSFMNYEFIIIHYKLKYIYIIFGTVEMKG